MQRGIAAHPIAHEWPWHGLPRQRYIERMISTDAHVRTPLLTLNIRAARPSDAESVATTIIESRSAFVSFAPMAHSPEDVHRWVAQALIPSGSVAVAQVGGEIVGVCAVDIEDGRAWINQLYVKPAWVGQRIGGRLLRAALQTLARPVWLYTFAENQGSRRFYERYGFVAEAFGDGSGNEEHCPDVLYRLDEHADAYEVSDEPNRMQLDAIHAYLTRSYWSAGIDRERVARAMAHSMNFGLFHLAQGTETQIGFARVVTDRSSFAYLCDVYVHESHRGKGLAKRLLDHILKHPELQTLRRFLLATRDGHGLYAQIGFTPLAMPERMMELLKPERPG